MKIQQWISTFFAHGLLLSVPMMIQVPVQRTGILLALLISLSQTPQKYLRDLDRMVKGRMKLANGPFPHLV